MLPESENNVAREFFLNLDSECRGQVAWRSALHFGTVLSKDPKPKFYLTIPYHVLPYLTMPCHALPYNCHNLTTLAVVLPGRIPSLQRPLRFLGPLYARLVGGQEMTGWGRRPILGR